MAFSAFSYLGLRTLTEEVKKDEVDVVGCDLIVSPLSSPKGENSLDQPDIILAQSRLQNGQRNAHIRIFFDP